MWLWLLKDQWTSNCIPHHSTAGIRTSAHWIVSPGFHHCTTLSITLKNSKQINFGHQMSMLDTNRSSYIVRNFKLSKIRLPMPYTNCVHSIFFLFLDQIGQTRYQHDCKFFLMEVVLSKNIICCPSYAVWSALKCEIFFCH
jgi:hypothetical protein